LGDVFQAKEKIQDIRKNGMNHFAIITFQYQAALEMLKQTIAK